MTEAERELLTLVAETLKWYVSREDNRNGRQLYLALEKLKNETQAPSSR